MMPERPGRRPGSEFGTPSDVAVGPLEPDGKRRVYAVGDTVVRYSTDAGQNLERWISVSSPFRSKMWQMCGAFQFGCGPPAWWRLWGTDRFCARRAQQVLAVEPGNPAKVYSRRLGGANGPTYYQDKVLDGTPVNTDCRRLAGEASVWLGDFSQFRAQQQHAQWALLPGPPVYLGASTPSGNTYVVTKATSSGFLLFFSDNGHVHVWWGRDRRRLVA